MSPRFSSQHWQPAQLAGHRQRNVCVCVSRCRNYGQHLVEDMFPHLWRLGAVKSDIVLFNFGVWHNDLAGFEGNASLVEAYLQAHRRELPFLVWRDSAPQHFDTPTGEFGCAGCPAPKAPYQCKVCCMLPLPQCQGDVRQ